jgi:hypothetical protein
MDSDANVTAVFDAVGQPTPIHILTVSKQGAGTGVVTRLLS